jgi:hypothetical protein
METYRAVLNGDQLTWIDRPPDLNAPTEVRVNVPERNERAAVSHGPAMAAALERIAKTGGISCIEDPVRWQRELREDRALPNRNA